MLELGKCLITRNAFGTIPTDEITQALLRHMEGDWGNVSQVDWEENDRALIEETRIISAYTSSRDVEFWIITEWDRSITVVLLPEDY
jgi:hypothetical protein